MYLRRYENIFGKIFNPYISIVIKTQIQLKHFQIKNKTNINETFSFHTNC